MRSFMIFATLMTLILSTAVVAGDWPQFLGPDRNNISSETKLAEKFPADGPETLWKVPLSGGFGSASVLDGKVYVIDHKGDQDIVRCLDLKDGKEAWSYSYDAPGKFGGGHPGSRCTPAVDDKYVFTVGPFGQFLCIDKATHKPLWQKRLLEDFGGRMPQWNVAQSPLLYKDWVIVAPQGRKAGVIACEKATGKIAWQTASIGGMSYASPMPATIGGVDQIIMLATKGRRANVVGIEAATGTTLWSYTGWGGPNPIPGPQHVGNGKVFLTAGYGSGSVMIQVTGSGKSFKAAEVFRLPADKCGSQIHQPLVVDDHLYVLSNDNRRREGLTCLDMTGKIKWQTKKSPNFEKGGLLLADGRIYILDGASGVLRIVQPDPKEYKEIASAKVASGKQIWAQMALADGKLFVRDQKQLRCVDLKAK